MGNGCCRYSKKEEDQTHNFDNDKPPKVNINNNQNEIIEENSHEKKTPANLKDFVNQSSSNKQSLTTKNADVKSFNFSTPESNTENTKDSNSKMRKRILRKGTHV